MSFKINGNVVINDDSKLENIADGSGITHSSNQVVTIGEQVWANKNLMVTHFRDGTPIPTGYTDAEWSSLTTAAYCTPYQNPHLVGYLYNWYAAADGKWTFVEDHGGICPEGFHIPSEAEWQTLKDYLGEDAGKKIKVMGDQYWNDGTGLPQWSNDANNISNFSAYPVTNRHHTGVFNEGLMEPTQYPNSYAAWWCSGQQGGGTGIWWKVSLYGPTLGSTNNPRQCGYNVRCIAG